MPRRHAAMAEHRVELVQLLDARAAAALFSSSSLAGSCRRLARSCAMSTISSSRFGRNSCSGGSIVRIVTGLPVHRLEHAVEVVALQRQQLVERLAPVGLVVGQNHLSARSGSGPRRRTCARCGTGRCRARRRRRRARRLIAAGRRWRGRPGGGTCPPTPAASRSAGRCPTSRGFSVPVDDLQDLARLRRDAAPSFTSPVRPSNEM